MNNEASRNAFEAWAKAVVLDTALWGTSPDAYKSNTTNAVWDAWQASREALEAEQAQIEGLRTQLARRTVERDMAIQIAACGEQVQQAAVPQGDWLWRKLMDFCKERGYAPASFDDLFAIVADAREAQQVAVPAQEARVKPLQWSNEQEPCDGYRYNHVVADSGLGRFSVEWKGWKELDSYTVYLANEYIGNSDTLAEAKLIAEQYVHRVVLSMIAAPQGDKQ